VESAAAGGLGALRGQGAASPSDCGICFQTAVALIVGLALAATAMADSRLRYFGFSGGCETETFVQETAPFSNLCVIDLQDQRLLDHEWVAKMTVRDIKLVVVAHDTFYERVPVTGQNRVTFELRKDFRQRWQKAIAGKETALATLAAFIYVADEPNWTGISRSELEAAHDEIKRSHLRARTLTSFNLMVNIDWFEGRDVPTDAVAYHQYSVFDPRVDPDFQANVAVIKSYALGKEILYVMDAWWTAALHGEEGIEPLDMAEVARNYYLMASEDPDAVGLIAFHWPTFDEGTGARDLPRDVKWRYWWIGSEITGKCLGPEGVDAETALFFEDCSYFATLEYEGQERGGFAAAMPRERGYGTWVLEEGNVVGGLKVQRGQDLIIYSSFYTDSPATIRIFDAADGRMLWESEPPSGHNRRPIRLSRETE
jgi:hypothetical protein